MFLCRYLSNWPGPMQMLMQQWPAMRHRDVEAHSPVVEESSMELYGTALLEVKQSKECRCIVKWTKMGTSACANGGPLGQELIGSMLSP